MPTFSTVDDLADHEHCADDIIDTEAHVAMTASERAKLAAVAAGATANAADAALRDRTTHTGVQPSSSIADFTEAVQDVIGALLAAGSNVSLDYNDATGTLTVTSAAGTITDAEVVRDTIGVALVGVGVVTVTVNDAADTITITSTATANATDAALRDRATHTGVQSADTITDGVTNVAYLASERTKLAAIADGATANSSDAALRDRGTHTGVQSSATISDFTEAVQDAVAALLGAGSNVTLNYNDAAGTLTVATTDAVADPEAVRDAIGIALVGAGLLSVVVNDAGDTITLSTTATANSTDAALRDRATHTGTQSLDTTTDSATRLAMAAAERTKLAAVAAGATANDTDANLKSRGNHTGTQDLDTTTDSATRLALTATERTKVGGVLAPLAATLANDAVATTETVIAQWTLPANLLTAAMLLNLQLLGQVSGTATLTFRVRIGTAGTSADALAAVFTTSAAGVANQHVTADILVACLTAGAAGTAAAGGQVQLGATVLPPATGAFASAAVNTTVQNKLSVTLVQSSSQTYTSRAAGLSRAG